MRLSCSFVNVYTIAYRAQSTFTRVHVRIPIGHPRESARVRQVGGHVGEDRRACPVRGKLNGEVAGHADILATILAREVSEDIRIGVGVGVRVGPVEFKPTIPKCLGPTRSVAMHAVRKVFFDL